MNSNPTPTDSPNVGIFDDQFFSEPINRHNTNCFKWDVDKPERDIIPLWVADMDLHVAPKITQALHERVGQAIFGYTKVPQSFYDAIVNWYDRRYQWKPQASSILYTIGVVPAVAAIIKALAKGEDVGVVMQTPAYNCFFSCIKNNGCHLLENKLVPQGNSYVIDFEDFERQVAKPDAKIFLLCSPHNPVGRIWTMDELKRMADICFKHNVTMVVDEIHSGVIMPGQTFTTFGSLGSEYVQKSVITASPSKSFNTAGLQMAYIICHDADMRASIDRAININEVCDVNPFGVIALQVAYNECEDWLNGLCRYVFGNYQALCQYLADNMPWVRVADLQGTYLAWVDFRVTGLSSQQLADKLLLDAKVRVSPGCIYGESDGFLRINLACPRQQLLEGLRRMSQCLNPLVTNK